MRLSDWIEEREAAGETPAPEEIEAERLKINADVEEKKQRALKAGGLFVLGTERHESRRIDNQLRGRSGRQGDPGASKFYLSLEDDLMRIFGAERMDLVLRKLGIKEGEAIAHPWINKALANAQKKVEARNFDMRKNVLKFDDVMNDQRKVVFEQRIDLMQEETVEEAVADMRREVVQELVTAHIPAKAFAEQWDVEGAARGVQGDLRRGRARRGMGGRGRHRRPGDRGAAARPRRQSGGAQGLGGRPREMRHIEKADPAAHARSPLARSPVEP